MPAAQKLLCRVDRIVDHGERVYTLVLRPSRPAPNFRAGQFLHLSIDPYDPSRFWPESRAFSIASPPSERDALRITYSVHGSFTSRMEAEVTEGRDVWIKMPYGTFAIDARSDAVLFAGGTGITAFTAFIESLTPEADRALVLAYGARSSQLFIYRDAVDRVAQRVPALDVVYFAEREESESAGRSRPQVGQVSVEAVW